MRTFERAGYIFEVRDGGPTDGEVIVLLHGFPQDAATWSDVEPLLHEAGYRTLAFDMRGVSPGARPESVRQYATIESIHDVTALLDAAGVEHAHLVGHDWGAYVAWATATECPERLLSLTVASTPHPGALRRSMTRSSQGIRSSYMLLFQVPGIAEAVLKPGTPLWNAFVRGLPPEHKQRYAQRMSDHATRHAALNWYRVMRYELTSPSFTGGPVSVPTTYVWGEYDPALGRFAAEATGHYVAAPYAFVQLRAGHWLPETRPELLAEAIVSRATSKGVA